MANICWHIFCINSVILWCAVVLAHCEWQPRDAFLEIRIKMDKVTSENCHTLNSDDLYLPTDAVSHLIDSQYIYQPVFANRTALLHLHNMAMNRAYFWSYILQSRFIRPVADDVTHDPGQLYHFLSTAADVSANAFINASATYFAPNSAYSPTFRDFFNKTMPRFAPRTFRSDDFDNLIGSLGENAATNTNAFDVEDLGAISIDATSKDYTNELYRINEWYRLWLPDNVDSRHDIKIQYLAEIRYANNTMEVVTFYGPNPGGDYPAPVKFTRPYFDCGRSNKWLVAAVVPIVDIYPRHTQVRHIEYPKYTAVSVLEMGYESIDINQCPKSPGNNGPNKFAGTNQCKTETTECEPIHGWGLRRGGYQCRCKPGYHLPPTVNRSFEGEIIERSSAEQYIGGFNCLKSGPADEWPYNWERAPCDIRDKYLNMYYQYRNMNGTSALQRTKINANAAVKWIYSVNQSTCHNFHSKDLTLKEDMSWGASKFFENEAKMALRLANFISAFLQISNPDSVDGGRIADRPLTEDQMIAETLSIVMSNLRIWSAGIYWEPKQFTGRTLFAPFAYKQSMIMRKFNVEDLARFNDSQEIYTEKPWYRSIKERWSSATNFDGLQRQYLNIKMRRNETGDFKTTEEQYPNFYRASDLSSGHWTTPYFDCDGFVKRWLITYAVPFFGWNKRKSDLEFKGVVAVSVGLLDMDINQCDDDSDAPNAFKGTHKCDRSSTHCVPISGRLFAVGGYRCDCRGGYEYLFNDPLNYFDGELVEAEFESLVNDKANRFDLFKCRSAHAN